MGNYLSVIGGLGLGACLAYILDPRMGRRRRAIARDKMIRLAHKTADAVDVTSRDLSNRVLGLAAQGRDLFREEHVSDRVLVERVRSRLGFLASHPGSIDVQAENGKVILSGPILAKEADHLVRRIASTKGVKAVENRLDVHQTADSIPGLQGEPGERAGEIPDILQTTWSPATRFLAGTAGGTLLIYGATRRDIVGTMMSVLGASVLARAITNAEFRRLVGIGAGRRAIDVHKIINVSAPVEKVFSFWTNYENFPKFMRNVRDVKQTDEKRSHWVVAGPAGAPIEWDAVLTRYIQNEFLSWETVPGSAVQHTGRVRFERNPDGSTRLDIRMSYNPVAGGLGHAVASLFGADPKTEMDDDLARMKTMIETGLPPHDAARKDQTGIYPR